MAMQSQGVFGRVKAQHAHETVGGRPQAGDDGNRRAFAGAIVSQQPKIWPFSSERSTWRKTARPPRSSLSPRISMSMAACLLNTAPRARGTAQPTARESVRVRTFPVVLQHLAGLRVNAHFVGQLAFFDVEGIAQAAAAMFFF